MKARRFWSKANPCFYVANIKPCLLHTGEKGDWGYTTDSKEAIDLTERQAMRFNADCNAVGVNAVFY